LSASTWPKSGLIAPSSVSDGKTSHLKSAPAEKEGEKPSEKGATAVSREPTRPTTKGRISKVAPFFRPTRFVRRP
jgi:hypothetical protein